MSIVQFFTLVLSKTTLSKAPGTPGGLHRVPSFHMAALFELHVFVVPKVQLILLSELTEDAAFKVLLDAFESLTSTYEISVDPLLYKYHRTPVPDEDRSLIKLPEEPVNRM